MKIYSVTDYDTTFVYTTLGWCIDGLKKYIKNLETKVYPYDDLKQRKIDTDSGNDVIFLFEIGNPQHHGITTQKLRGWYPNAKIACFCSDTMYYQVNNLGFQMDPSGIDLHLELVPQCIERFEKYGIPAELWKWTGSERLFSLAKDFYDNYNINKLYDFIGVYGPWTIANPECWRYKAVNYLSKRGYTFTNGGGDGHGDKDLNRLFQKYMESVITLGTTSHNRPELTELGTQKGFRDWLGPILGSLLIYDGHKNINDIFNSEQDLVPTYDYYNYENIIELYQELQEEVNFEVRIEQQRNWAWANTLEKQLVKIFLKYGWITKDVLS